MKDLDDILKRVIITARKAGKVILSHYDKDCKVSQKGPDSPVTQADLDSNKVILKGLKRFKYGILSEETADDKSRLDKQRVWIIDPMDGTRDFIKKTGDFTIMIGLVERSWRFDPSHHRPILGVIYKPVDDILYYAIRNLGAFRQAGGGEPVKIGASHTAELQNIRMLSSRFHRSVAEAKLAERLGISKPDIFGSSFKLCMIAEGRAELNFNPSNRTWEWDVCAADIILSEASGRITDMRGEGFVYNKKNPRNKRGYVASNERIHREIIGMLNPKEEEETEN